MEAGIAAFQGDQHFYELMVVQEGKTAKLEVRNASETLASMPLKKYKAGKPVMLKIVNDRDVVRCMVIGEDDKWIQVGDDLNGKHLSTQEAGGFVGTTLGVQAYGENGGKAAFEKVVYQEGE